MQLSLLQPLLQPLYCRTGDGGDAARSSRATLPPRALAADEESAAEAAACGAQARWSRRESKHDGARLDGQRAGAAGGRQGGRKQNTHPEVADYTAVLVLGPA